MRMLSRDRVTLALQVYQAYNDLKGVDSSGMFRAVDEYDRWFLQEVPVVLANALTLEGNRFTGLDTASKVLKVSHEISDKARQLLSEPITKWVTNNYDGFYRKGIEIAVLNAKAEGKEISEKLDRVDANSIQLQVRQELNIWKGHWIKHDRQVERELVGFVLSRGSIEQFQGRMTVPSGHITAFPYGNGRVSWYELIRRTVNLRGRQVASVAQQNRLV